MKTIPVIAMVASLLGTAIGLVGDVAAEGQQVPKTKPRRIAALIVAASQEHVVLAKHATEVAISAIAAGPGGTIMGTEEFVRRLGIEAVDGLVACVSEASCLARASVALGLSEAVVGLIGGDDEVWRVNLQLIEVSTSTVKKQLQYEYAADPAELLSGVSSGVVELFTVTEGELAVAGHKGALVYVGNRVVGTSPLVVEDLPVGTHQVRVEYPGEASWEGDVVVKGGAITHVNVQLSVHRAALPRSRAAKLILFSGAGAGLALGTGGLVSNLRANSLAEVYSQNKYADEVAVKTREDSERLWRVAKGLYLSSAIITVASGVIFFIDPGRTEGIKSKTAGISLGVVPIDGGAVFTLSR